MRRRALLAGVAATAVGTAGCVGSLPGSGTPTATPYPDETVELPPGPKSPPERPADLTAETAADFVTRFEYRYSYNDHWEGSATEIGFSERSCSVESTAERGAGYLVTVQCVGYVNQPSDDPESTATIHYDLPPWTVRYYVDADSVLRTEVG